MNWLRRCLRTWFGVRSWGLDPDRTEIGVSFEQDQVALILTQPQGNFAVLTMAPDTADRLAHQLIRAGLQVRATGGELRPQDAGEPTPEAVEIKKYTFFLHTSQGLFRFDRPVNGFLIPGQEVGYAMLQFSLDPEGNVQTGDGWESTRL